MSNSDIRIMIIGKAGSGKSTVSSIIERALLEEGLSVSHMPNPDMEDHTSEQFKNRHKRADLAIYPLRERDGSVVLHEVQAAREASLGPSGDQMMVQTMRAGR